MKKIKKLITIMGTLLITMVLIISGSAVATWVYGQWIYEENTTQTDNINNEDGNYASLGQDGPPPVLGCVLLDLGSLNAMPADHDFTVFADTSANESYTVFVSEIRDLQYKYYVGSGWDTEDLTFQTPSSPPSASWRYIFLNGTSGVQAGDYAYGPDIDAVGWDKP